MPPLLETNKLSVYLQDHLAGATGGLELARRARSSNPDGELGDFLGQLAHEIAEDREALISIMDHLGAEPDRLKIAAAWTGEKLGRLKPNGQLTGYSPLSRLVELEGLHVGVSGKLSLWENLQAAMGEHLVNYDLEGLIDRAHSQIDGLRTHRRAAAIVALDASA
jgi:hypothetical protein